MKECDNVDGITLRQERVAAATAALPTRTWAAGMSGVMLTLVVRRTLQAGVAALAAFAWLPSVHAQTPAAPQGSPTVPPSFYDDDGPPPDRWYHVVPYGEGHGAEITRGVYDRIGRSAGARRVPARLDTVIEYGPGHWTYEWEAEADRMLDEAKAAERGHDGRRAEQAYLEAARMFTVGSSPHLRSDPNAMRALNRARAAFLSAARYFPGSFKAIRIPHAGKTFEAYLHLPPGKGPFPVLVASNGSDVVKEQASPALRHEVIRRGIALLSLDMPGIGGSSEYQLRAESDELHVAAVKYLRSLRAINGRKVAVMGTSFGGNAAARILSRPELELAAVISACAPLHTAFVLPTAVLALLPPLPIEGVRDRVGLSPDASYEQLGAALKDFSLKLRPASAAEAKVSTPLLVLATDADPVAPLADLPLITQTSSSVKTIVFHKRGHCPDPAAAQPAAAHWLEGTFAAIRPALKARAN